MATIPKSTKGISAYEVSKTIGVGSFDVKTLCMSWKDKTTGKDSGRLNKWARHKPIEYKSPLPLTDDQRKKLCFGLTIPTLSFVKAQSGLTQSEVKTLIEANSEWVYTGSSTFCRLSDFHGYAHEGVSFDVANELSRISLSFTFSINQDTTNGVITPTDIYPGATTSLDGLTSVSNMYIGVAIFKQNTSLNYELVKDSISFGRKAGSTSLAYDTVGSNKSMTVSVPLTTVAAGQYLYVAFFADTTNSAYLETLHLIEGGIGEFTPLDTLVGNLLWGNNAGVDSGILADTRIIGNTDYYTRVITDNTGVENPTMTGEPVDYGSDVVTNQPWGYVTASGKDNSHLIGYQFGSLGTMTLNGSTVNFDIDGMNPENYLARRVEFRDQLSDYGLVLNSNEAGTYTLFRSIVDVDNLTYWFGVTIKSDGSREFWLSNDEAESGSFYTIATIEGEMYPTAEGDAQRIASVAISNKFANGQLTGMNLRVVMQKYEDGGWTLDNVFDYDAKFNGASVFIESFAGGNTVADSFADWTFGGSALAGKILYVGATIDTEDSFSN